MAKKAKGPQKVMMLDELIAQLGEEFCGFRQGLHGIEGIEQTPLAGRARHELRDALRALSAARERPHGVGLKAAFLPDDAGEKFKRQIVGPRRGFDHQADRLPGVGVCRLVRRDCEFFDARYRHAKAVI